MSKKNTLAAGTSPFAHLLGGAAALAGRALGRKAEEEDAVPGPDDADDDKTDAEDAPEDEPEKGKRGKKAEGEDDADDADAEDESDDADAEEPEDKEQAKAFRDGRAAERKRCAAIFSSPAAAGRPDLAATLAFSTSQTSAEAIAVLGAANAPGLTLRGRSLDDRMGSRVERRPGAGGGSGKGEATFADQMAAANKKAGR
jgi:hypothetical protein